MNLENLPFDEFSNHAVLTLKSSLYAPKSDHELASFERAAKYIDTVQPPQVENGSVAVYMKTHAIYYGAEIHLMVLDIEHPEKHHTSVPANIETAQNLYTRLDAYGLVNNLIVGLSGNGLRFIWPYAVPYKYKLAFETFINDSRSFPGIDPAPQNKNTFVRMLAYRGSTTLGAKPINKHITYFNDAAQLMNLNHRLYEKLTLGRPNYAKYTNILPKLLPKQ